MLDLLTIAAVLIAYAAFSRPLGARGLTSAVVLTAGGFVAGTAVLGLIDVGIESATAETLAEGALVLLLFADAARIDLVLTTVVVTVALSVFAHGITSVPLVERYQRWHADRAAEHPGAPEAAPTNMPRLRRQASAAQFTIEGPQAAGGGGESRSSSEERP